MYFIHTVTSLVMRGQAAREGNACAPTACTIHHADMQYTKTNSFYYAALSWLSRLFIFILFLGGRRQTTAPSIISRDCWKLKAIPLCKYHHEYTTLTFGTWKELKNYGLKPSHKCTLLCCRRLCMFCVFTSNASKHQREKAECAAQPFSAVIYLANDCQCHLFLLCCCLLRFF
jgi:hypothetical protein